MELELVLAPPTHACPPAGSCLGKRGSAEAFRANKATLPLFVHVGDGGDENCSGQDRDWEMNNKKKKRLVGWPPVKSAHRHRRGAGGGHVKVQMEGVPIGRKVDLRRHGSYDELHGTLHLMFPSSTTPQDAEEGLERRGRARAPCVVTYDYEDGDGEWMLVGDVPWEDFGPVR